MMSNSDAMAHQAANSILDGICHNPSYAKIDQAVNHSCIADLDDLLLTTWVPEAMLTRIENIESLDVSDHLTDCANSVASRMI